MSTESNMSATGIQMTLQIEMLATYLSNNQQVPFGLKRNYATFRFEKKLCNSI